MFMQTCKMSIKAVVKAWLAVPLYPRRALHRTVSLLKAALQQALLIHSLLN